MGLPSREGDPILIELLQLQKLWPDDGGVAIQSTGVCFLNKWVRI